MAAERFEALDGLRGVAAAMVLLHHVELAGFTSHFMVHGDLGVDLFFALSGFVIAHAYEKRMRAGMHLADFVRLRMIRLYPLMALGVVLAFLCAVEGLMTVSGDPLQLIALQLLWIPLIWGSSFLFPLNTVQWSLLFELFANLLHANTWKWLTTRALVMGVALLVPILAWTAQHYGTLGIGWGKENLLGAFPRTLFSYGVGLLCYRLYSAGRLPRLPIPWPVIFAAPFAAVLLEDHTAGFLNSGWRDFFVVAGVFPIVIWAAINARLPAPVGRLAVFGGLISYPVYALQGSMLAANDTLLSRLSLQGPAVYVAWASAVACLLLAAWLALKFFDEPLRSWINRRIEPCMRPNPAS